MLRHFLMLLVLGSMACTAKGSIDSGSPSVPAPARAQAPDAGHAELAECRRAAGAARETNDWGSAEKVCASVATDKPAELSEVITRVRREAGAAKHLSAARDLVVRRSYQAALVELDSVPADTRAYAVGSDVLKAATDGMLAQQSLECGTALMHQQPNTVELCDRYFQARCEAGPRPDAVPPEKKKLKLDGPLGRDGWRPDDPLLLRFLIARHKSNPHAASWACAGNGAVDDSGCGSTEDFSAHYAAPGVNLEALQLYCIQGAGAAQKLAATETKLAEQAAEAGRAYQAGHAALDSGQLEKAAEQFRIALQYDAKLMPPGDGKGPKSVIHRKIELEFSPRAYEQGNELASAGKYEPACTAWKVGHGFSKENADLTRALGLCTARAHQLLTKMKRCEELPPIERLAVEGDGMHEAAAKRAAELHCVH